MSTRSKLLDDIVTRYVVVISRYVKIHKMHNFTEFMNTQVRSPLGRISMIKQLTKIHSKATVSDKKEINNIIDLLQFYDVYVD